MKRTIIALVTVVTATLIYQHSEKVVASDPIPPSLIGDWEIKGDQKNTVAKDLKLHFYDDGSFSFKIDTVTRPGGIYGQCATFEFSNQTGRFNVNENKITLHYLTGSENGYAACALSVTPTSTPKSYNQNRYKVVSFSLQNNGQTLVLTDNQQAIYQKSSP